MPTQRYNNSETVVDAARRRISFVFDSFDNVIVSVSGGKDSTVLAHLALLEARRRGRRVGLFFLDEEVTYQSSVDQVEHLMTLYPEVTIPLWLQIPFKLTNATSLTEGQLMCWEPGKHKLWMRPKKAWAIQHKPWDPSTETVGNRAKGFGFYDAIANFERGYTDTAFLVGLRAAGESPNRWRAVTKNPIDVAGQRVFWGTRKGRNSVLYPVFDWNYHDVWRYIHDERLRYSKIFDFMFMKGYPITEMRVSSLIHERSFKSICDLPAFEPRTYDKLLKRIKGIALAQETARSSKLFAARKLPQQHASWLAYRDYLIATHPNATHAEIFRARFAHHLQNEFVARQQVRQLLLNDYENNLPINNDADPRERVLAYYRSVL
jgi:predicted phosphoadenosine phosphosulfate sulfurtransferase